MKKFYYFSKFKIESVDLRNYRKKFAGLVAGISIATIVVLFGLYSVYVNFINPPKDLTSLRNENLYLQKRLNALSGLYRTMGSQLDSLKENTKTLRTAANLQPITSEQEKLATGGNTFGSLLQILSGKNGELTQTLSGINEVVKKFEFEKANLNEIQSALANNKQLYQSIPAIKPCSGELAAHGFGMRLHPILNITTMHLGIDILTAIGTPVYAPADGQIEFTGVKNGFGICVEINHGYGYRTIYGHLSGIVVKEGQRVKRNQLIARTGNTGLSTGPHLHYEVLHNGTNLDPIQFFFDDNYVFSNTAVNN